ncbi:heavy-metal-associated domain-containing protein [Bacillus massilinigeriensis]|uniref:heavy-metal-associated domain-containing protein n=1 Tax=Bacillus massilionigeriensis TaxID=1805475 RepID=UPI00096B2620|nr:heavy-metal-associated domain-containing protein [Bacillus massilionigeriensis]
MATVTYSIEELSCPSCVKGIEGALAQQAGVQDVKVLFNASKVKVIYDPEIGNPERYAEVLQKIGYPVVKQR